MRLRIRYTKLGKVRFTSHRDGARIWERALRRAELPVAYSGGFSPRPRLSFGLALPTGAESIAEYLDVELDAGRAADLDPEEVTALLSPCLPHGMDATVAAVVDRGGASLQEAVISCTWFLSVSGTTPAALERHVERILEADSVVVTRERKGREVVDDLRPALLSLTVTGAAAGGAGLEADLGVHPRSVRPAELVAAMAPELSLGRVTRTHQWIERNGARVEPLCPPAHAHATSAPHAEVRAS